MSGRRIDEIFASHRRAGRAALMPFITGGYPTLEATEACLPALEQAGASIVEIGIPFSDPIADGPVIAAAMHEALQGGASPERLFGVVERLRPSLNLGVVAMVSDSIVARMGARQFVEAAAKAGVDGLIIPDIDLDAARTVRKLSDEHGLTFTLLIAPTTPPSRQAQIAEICSGFVYLLARLGITGEREATPEIAQRVKALREMTDLPIAAGFGISRREHVAAVTETADAAIVGSALVRRMGQAADPVAAAAEFIGDLAAGLRGHGARSVERRT